MSYPKYLLLFFGLCAFWSCEKEIELDLENSAPRLTIEAQLVGGDQTFEVRISRSTDFFVEEPATLVNNASVQLTDEAGNTFNIPATGNGTYLAQVLATPNQFYQLEVELDGQLYTARSFLNPPVFIDSLELEFQEENAFQDEGYLVYTRFNDDPSQQNFYRFVHAVNDTIEGLGEDLQVLDDVFFDGGFVRIPIFGKTFESGSEVLVELQHIDEVTYNYFNALADIVGDGQGPGGSSAAPGNPDNNWDQDILGFFGASSRDTMRVLIP